MKKYNLETGKLGESMARDYLENKGYFILEQNYENKYAEIDIVAKEKDTVVFVEVKTRIGEQFGTPEDGLNKEKMNRLLRNAHAYVAMNVGAIPCGCPYRIDAICIVLDRARQIQRINHYQNITS
ncbi:YraN family protein [Patescibacteria group bacterium]|nr:YraN family protein [Patescibacteria group bacterium]